MVKIELEGRLEQLEAECKRIQTELATLREAKEPSLRPQGTEVEIEDATSSLFLGSVSEGAKLRIKMAMSWGEGMRGYAWVVIRMLRSHEDIQSPHKRGDQVSLSARFEDTEEEFTNRILYALEKAGIENPVTGEQAQGILSRIHTQWIGALK